MIQERMAEPIFPAPCRATRTRGYRKIKHGIPGWPFPAGHGDPVCRREAGGGDLGVASRTSSGDTRTENCRRKNGREERQGKRRFG